MTENEDVRLDENQRMIMKKMMEQGMDEREAKLRTMCIAKAPDHYLVVNSGHQAYPKMVYHPDGRHRVCQTPEEWEVASAAGWLDHPHKVHLDKFQTPNAKVVLTSCPNCEAEAVPGAKFCASCGQSLVPEEQKFETPIGAAIAVDKQRKADKSKSKKD